MIASVTTLFLMCNIIFDTFDFHIGTPGDQIRHSLNIFHKLTEFLGGSYEEQGDYPAWEYRKDSRMRDLMADVYEELFGEKPVVKAIHAGLECGLFYDKIPGLDCVSFGPTMIDIHTTGEKLSIPSTEKMWKYLVRTLEKMNTIR